MAKKKVGKITHFFSHISVAVVKLSGGLKKGDKILIEGSTTSFEQKADSMQVEHKPVASAKKGQSIGLKVKDRVREGDDVYLVSE
jgi:translation elongation factor EF-1alpha